MLNSVKRKAYRLDLQLSVCGFRLGWAGVIGLIPWLGDIIGFLLALQLVHKADNIEGGVPAGIRLKMISNIIWDFVMGLIPLVGDFMNILYKCNSRNFILLEKHLVEKYGAMNPVSNDKRSGYQLDHVGEDNQQQEGIRMTSGPMGSENV